MIAAKAADLIEERGHAKGILETFDGKLCLLGALNMAAWGSARHHSGGYQALRYVEQFIPGNNDRWRRYNGVDWNNQPERTQEEVVAVLRAAAGVAAPIKTPHEGNLAA